MAIKHAENGKRDLHGLELEYDNALKALKSEKWKHEANKRKVEDYLDACRKGKAKSAGNNIRIGKSTLYRILGILRMLSEDWLDKDLDEAHKEAISAGEEGKPHAWGKFYDRMEEGKLKNNRGKAFAPSTRSKNYKVVRKFLKWTYGNNRAYPGYCEEWVTREPIKSRACLMRSEVERMVEAAGSLRTKALLMVLFDGGFRIEELANLRWVDVRKPEGKGYYQAHVRAETSKTNKERFVSLWLSTDLLDSYLSACSQDKDYKPQGYLFRTSYHNLYMTVRRIGQKVLGQKVSPHDFRHASATHYASVIRNYQMFCARYGWTLRSSSPQRYFHKVHDEDVADQAKEHEIARFKTDFERIKLQNESLLKQMETQREELEELKAISQARKAEAEAEAQGAPLTEQQIKALFKKWAREKK